MKMRTIIHLLGAGKIQLSNHEINLYPFQINLFIGPWEEINIQQSGAISGLQAKKTSKPFPIQLVNPSLFLQPQKETTFLCKLPRCMRYVSRKYIFFISLISISMREKCKQILSIFQLFKMKLLSLKLANKNKG